MRIEHELTANYAPPNRGDMVLRTVIASRMVGSDTVVLTVPKGPLTAETVTVRIPLNSLEYTVQNLRARGEYTK